MKKIEYKKILIVSHNSMSLHSNNGKTLTSIFSSWDSDKIAQLYFQEEIPESLCFNNFFRIRDLDIIKIFLGMGEIGACGNKILPMGKVLCHYEGAGVVKISILKFLRKFDAFKLLLRDVVYGTKLWCSKLLLSWIDDFSPDSVFFVGGNSTFSFFIAVGISKIRNIPIDIYITDDYVLNAEPKGALAIYMHRKLMRVYGDIFGVARHIFVIGDDMADAFRNKFCREFVPIMNCLDFPENLSRHDFSLKTPGQVDIVYAGGLHLGRDKSLAKFGELIKSVSAEVGLNVKLSVYSFQSPSENILDCFDRYGVVYGGALDQGEVVSRLSNADFVLHVESFDNKYVSMTKLSISTKIPEYLASGACLLAYGPSELASIRLVWRNKIGVCLTENDGMLEMMDKLISVINSVSRREEIVRRGFEFAKSNFDGSVARERLEKLLNY